MQPKFFVFIITGTNRFLCLIFLTQYANFSVNLNLTDNAYFIQINDDFRDIFIKN
jgi:hypothetical protein